MGRGGAVGHRVRRRPDLGREIDPIEEPLNAEECSAALRLAQSLVEEVMKRRSDWSFTGRPSNARRRSVQRWQLAYKTAQGRTATVNFIIRHPNDPSADDIFEAREPGSGFRIELLGRRLRWAEAVSAIRRELGLT